jgi:hypothetical protein
LLGRRAKGFIVRVRVLVHLERVADSDTRFVWWAETPDVERFSAAADHLADLMDRTELALRDILAAEDLDISYRLVGKTRSAHGPVTQRSGGSQGEEVRGASPVLVSVP